MSAKKDKVEGVTKDKVEETIKDQIEDMNLEMPVMEAEKQVEVKDEIKREEVSTQDLIETCGQKMLKSVGSYLSAELNLKRLDIEVIFVNKIAETVPIVDCLKLKKDKRAIFLFMSNYRARFQPGYPYNRNVASGALNITFACYEEDDFNMNRDLAKLVSSALCGKRIDFGALSVNLRGGEQKIEIFESKAGITLCIPFESEKPIIGG